MLGLGVGLGGLGVLQMWMHWVNIRVVTTGVIAIKIVFRPAT